MTTRSLTLCLCAAFGLLALQLAGAGGLAQAQSTYQWPDFQPDLQPGPSNSDVKAKPPTVTLSPPTVGTPPAERVKFSGYWQGWMCRDRIVDVNVLVTKVTDKGAKVRYAVASEHVKTLQRPVSYTRSARFDADVLRLRLGQRTEIILGMRADGYMNIKWDSPPRGWCTGIMQRTLAPPPDAASTNERERTAAKPDP